MASACGKDIRDRVAGDPWEMGEWPSTAGFNIGSDMEGSTCSLLVFCETESSTLSSRLRSMAGSVETIPEESSTEASGDLLPRLFRKWSSMPHVRMVRSLDHVASCLLFSHWRSRTASECPEKMWTGV